MAGNHDNNRGWSGGGDIKAAMEFAQSATRGGGGRRSAAPSITAAPRSSNTPRGTAPRAPAVAAVSRWSRPLATSPPGNYTFSPISSVARESTQPTTGDRMDIDETSGNTNSTSGNNGLGVSMWAAMPNHQPVHANVAVGASPMSSTTTQLSAVTAAAANGHDGAQSGAQPHSTNINTTLWTAGSTGDQGASFTNSGVGNAAASNPRGNAGTVGAGPASLTSPTQLPVGNSSAGLVGTTHGAGLSTLTTTKPEPAERGIEHSRWAKSAFADKSSGVPYKKIDVKFGVDKGRVIDDDWEYTFDMTRLGEILVQAADKARTGGDTHSEAVLRQAAKQCNDLVYARSQTHNKGAELRARDALNKGREITKQAFKKTRPLMDEHFGKKYVAAGGIVAGQPLATGFTTQPATHHDSRSPLETTTPVANSTANDGFAGPGAQGNDFGQSRVANCPLMGAASGFASKILAHDSSSAQALQPQARPVQQAHVTHQQPMPVQQPQAPQQPLQASQGTDKPPRGPSGLGQAVPVTFDDPAAEWLFENFFKGKGKN